MVYSEIFCPSPKNYVGATKNNTGETFENKGALGKIKYEGAYKISWGFEK